MEKIETAPSHEKGAKYITVDKKDLLLKLLKELKEAPFFVFDTETTGTDPLLAEMVSLP